MPTTPLISPCYRLVRTILPGVNLAIHFDGDIFNTKGRIRNEPESTHEDQFICFKRQLPDGSLTCDKPDTGKFSAGNSGTKAHNLG